jgi:hypothetical protein
MFRLVLKNSGKEKERDPRSLRGPSDEDVNDLYDVYSKDLLF